MADVGQSKGSGQNVQRQFQRFFIRHAQQQSVPPVLRRQRQYMQAVADAIANALAFQRLITRMEVGRIDQQRGGFGMCQRLQIAVEAMIGFFRCQGRLIGQLGV